MSKAKKKAGKVVKARSTPPAAAEVKKQKPNRKSRSPYKGKKLSPGKLETLVSLERTIDKALAEFVNVGSALQRIRDERLYKASHPKFEEYCKARWKFSVKHAYRLIAAAKIVEQLKAGKGRVSRKSLPTREAQVRPLAQLWETADCDPVSIWKQALKENKGKAPTAALISKLVNVRLGKADAREDGKRGSAGGLTPKDQIAEIRKFLEEVGSKPASQFKKAYETTLKRIREILGQPEDLAIS